MGRKNNKEKEGKGVFILDFLGYDYFEDFGIIGKILWIICLPFILIIKIIGLIFDLIF